MPYIPKSRIQPNLYTAGKDYVIQGTLKPYVGYFYRTYTGEVFTGKNPDDKPNRLLIPPPSLPQANQTQVFIKDDIKNQNYKTLKGVEGNNIRNTPQLFFTQPTESDYQLGEFRRYFCKKRNESIFLEISQSDYNNLLQQSSTIDYEFWAPFNLPWTLVGDPKKVFDINRNIVLLKEKNEKYYGLGKYLQERYLRYHRP